MPSFSCFCDAAIAWQFGMQDPATPVADGIIRFHHDLMFILLLVVFFVCWMLFKIVTRFNSIAHYKASQVVHGTFIEIVWTLIPAFLLIIIAIPSFSLLYSVDETTDPALTLKIVAHQWYWSYEYADYVFGSIGFDSYMLSLDSLVLGDLRLLEVDNRVVFPIDTHSRLIVTSADVLHCWAVPSFGLKLDACPGRLNEAGLFLQRPGVFFGQCSEICGVNHGFMPIAVEVLSRENYLLWMSNLFTKSLSELFFFFWENSSEGRVLVSKINCQGFNSFFSC